jgi:hypothetical protein
VVSHVTHKKLNIGLGPTKTVSQKKYLDQPVYVQSATAIQCLCKLSSVKSPRARCFRGLRSRAHADMFRWNSEGRVRAATDLKIPTIRSRWRSSFPIQSRGSGSFSAVEPIAGGATQQCYFPRQWPADADPYEVDRYPICFLTSTTTSFTQLLAPGIRTGDHRTALIEWLPNAQKRRGQPAVKDGRKVSRCRVREIRNMGSDGAVSVSQV